MLESMKSSTVVCHLLEQEEERYTYTRMLNIQVRNTCRHSYKYNSDQCKSLVTQ